MPGEEGTTQVGLAGKMSQKDAAQAGKKIDDINNDSDIQKEYNVKLNASGDVSTLDAPQRPSPSGSANAGAGNYQGSKGAPTPRSAPADDDYNKFHIPPAADHTTQLTVKDFHDGTWEAFLDLYTKKPDGAWDHTEVVLRERAAGGPSTGWRPKGEGRTRTEDQEKQEEQEGVANQITRATDATVCGGVFTPCQGSVFANELHVIHKGGSTLPCPTCKVPHSPQDVKSSVHTVGQPTATSIPPVPASKGVVQQYVDDNKEGWKLIGDAIGDAFKSVFK